jgi:hypothetical protein
MSTIHDVNPQTAALTPTQFTPLEMMFVHIALLIVNEV